MWTPGLIMTPFVSWVCRHQFAYWHHFCLTWAIPRSVDTRPSMRIHRGRQTWLRASSTSSSRAMSPHRESSVLQSTCTRDPKIPVSCCYHCCSWLFCEESNYRSPTETSGVWLETPLEFTHWVKSGLAHVDCSVRVRSSECFLLNRADSFSQLKWNVLRSVVRTYSRVARL